MKSLQDDSTEETSADDAPVDLDTEDGTEDPQDPVNDTQDGEDNSSVDIDFSAGEDQTADAAAGDQAVEEELNELGAGESVTSEKSVLYYTKWKNEDGKWKLLKPSTKTQLAETTEDNAVTGDTATDTDAEETTEETTEETGADVSVQSTEEDTQTAGTSEAEDNTGDTEDVGAVTYYTDELVNVDTIDPATGEVLASGYLLLLRRRGYLATGYKDVDGTHIISELSMKPRYRQQRSQYEDTIQFQPWSGTEAYLDLDHRCFPYFRKRRERGFFPGRQAL